MINAELLSIRDLNISVKYEDSPVKIIRGVDLDVRKGEIIGILGESGSGKTVLSTSIPGLFKDDESIIPEGQINYKGDNLINLSEKQLMKIRGKEIAYIFQNPVDSLNPNRKVGKQVEEILKIHGEDFSRERVIEIMKSVGMDNADSVYDLYPYQLSGGMCQRIMIAMSIACKPNLLIADEPTSSIDASLQEKVLNLLKDINKIYGSSIILVTHDFDVAKLICSRVVIMYAGLVMEEGDMQDIIERPLHPYTEGLINCVKSLGAEDKRLYTMGGMSRNITDYTDYCPFYERCGRRTDECRIRVPDMLEIENGRKVRCINIKNNG